MLLPMLAAAAMLQGGHIDTPYRQRRYEPVYHEHLKQVAIVPWYFRGGTDTAVRTAKDTIDSFFDRANFDRLSKARVDRVWVEGMGEKEYDLVNGSEQDPMPPLPSDEELRHLGRQLGVDVVCAGNIDWHTRSIWVALGPKTSAICTVNMKIVDMDKDGAVLDERDVQAEDTAEENGFATAASLLTGTLVTVVSGGPKTPHQQYSAQVALSKAFEPWLEGVFREVP